MIADTLRFFKNKAATLANDLFCIYKEGALLVAMCGIYLKLEEMADAMSFGAHDFAIEPITLTTTPIKILEKNIGGRVRKVDLWVDSATGGPTPTIRVGTAASGSGGGGVRVSAGQVNPIGEVPPNVELWASASTTINAYVLRRS